MNILKIKNMRWGDANKTAVAILADTSEASNLSIGTPYDSSSVIWDQIKDYPQNDILPYTPPEVTEQEVIALRNKLLAESDWTQLPDVSVDKQAWVEYRQALRDIPGQPKFPKEVYWPNIPIV
jgi:hypothetical protein